MTVDVRQYDPLVADLNRYLTAIARRNIAWAHMREAEFLLRMAERSLRPDVRPYRQNFNQCQDGYERAHRDLIHERVFYREGRKLEEWSPVIAGRL